MTTYTEFYDGHLVLEILSKFGDTGCSLKTLIDHPKLDGKVSGARLNTTLERLIEASEIIRMRRGHYSAAHWKDKENRKPSLVHFDLPPNQKITVFNKCSVETTNTPKLPAASSSRGRTGRTKSSLVNLEITTLAQHVHMFRNNHRISLV